MYNKCNKSIILDSRCLLEHEHVKLNVIIRKKNNTLIQGIVYNPQDIPIQNACVEIIRKNKENDEEILGYVFTNGEGKYGVVLEIDPCSEYIFNVYSSL